MQNRKKAPREDQHLERTTSNARGTTRKTRKAEPAVVRTTVGDLIAAAVDTAGPGSVSKVLGSGSPIAKHLRQRLVFVSGDFTDRAWV